MSKEPRKKRGVEDAPLPAYVAHYKINRLLGKGIIGCVYEAVEEKPPRNVALKVVRGEFFSKSALKRFHVQAESLVRLQHPNLAAVFGTGIAKVDDGLQAYFAGELVSGQALESFARARQLTNEQRLLLVAQVAEAMQYAHSKGVVHRDLKPANIYVGKDGQPKILDIGVVKCTDADVAAVEAQADIGVLSYMAPEQTTGNGSDIDTRTDIYALGVIAFHVLTGRLPYDLKLPEFGSAVEVIRETPAKRLSEFDPTLRGEIETVVARALEKDPARRQQTALEFASDIRRVVGGEAELIGSPAAGKKYIVAGLAALCLALLAGFVVNSIRLSRAIDAENKYLAESAAQAGPLRDALGAAEEAKQAQASAADEVDKANKAKQAADDKAAAALAAQEKAQAQLQTQAQLLKTAQEQASQTAVASPTPTQVVQAAPAAPVVYPLPLAEQGESLLQSGAHDEAMDRLLKARVAAAEQSGSTQALDLVLTNLLLQYPPPVYFNSALRGATEHIFLLPDGHSLVASDGRDVVVVDAATGSVKRRFGNFGANIRNLAVSLDGTLVATTAHVKPRFLAVFTVADGKQLQFHTDTPTPSSLAFSPKGTPLAFVQDGKISIFEPRDFTKTQSVNLDVVNPHVAFSRDGAQIFVTGSNHHFFALAADTLKTIYQVNNAGEGGFVTAVPAADGKSLFVGSDEGLVRRSLPGYAVLSEYPGAYGTNEALSPSGKLLAMFSGHGVHLFDAASCREIGLFEDQIPFRSLGNSLAITADSSMLIDSDFYSGLRAWPITSRFPNPLGAHGGNVRALAISPDSLVGISSADDHTARLWDLASGMPLGLVGGHEGTCQAMAFGKDAGSFYSVGLEGTFSTWDTAGRTVTASKKIGAAALGALAISPDGQSYAAGGAAGSPVVIKTLSGDAQLGSFPNDPAWAECEDVEFSPDGAMVAANTAGGADLFDLHGMTRVEIEKSLEGAVVTFSHDGSMIFAGTQTGELASWTIGGAAPTFRESHGGKITCLRTSPDGAVVAAAGVDRTITLSDASTLSTITTFRGFPAEVNHLALSADGRYLMAGAGNDVYLIDLKTGSDYVEQYDLAQAARTALDNNPSDPAALLRLGLYYASRHADAWAVELLTHARTAGADVPHLPLARSYWRLHQTAAALQEFREALAHKEGPEYYIRLCINAVNYPPPGE